MGKPHLTLASICISWALFGLSPSNAQTLTDEAGRACSQAVTTPDDAIISCSAVIDSGTVSGRQLAAAYAQRGYARTLKRSLTEAEADLDAAIKIDPDYAEAYADRAIADYTETMRLRPGGSASVYGPRGVAYHRKGDEAHAVADYSESLKAEPNDVGMLLNRGDALRNMHEWSRAGAGYSEAIRLAPDNPGGWKGRGYIRVATQDPEGAVA